MKSRRWLVALVLVALVCVLHTLTLAAGLLDHLQTSSLVIKTADGTRHDFRVYEAVTPQDRSRGLMYVEELDEDEGMIFYSGANMVSSIWMKNTPIYLDVLFVRADGTISGITPNMIPYSRKTVSSREPVRAVVEIGGGISERLGIRNGDKVLHHLLGNSTESEPDEQAQKSDR